MRYLDKVKKKIVATDTISIVNLKLKEIELKTQMLETKGDAWTDVGSEKIEIAGELQHLFKDMTCKVRVRDLMAAYGEIDLVCNYQWQYIKGGSNGKDMTYTYREGKWV